VSGRSLVDSDTGLLGGLPHRGVGRGLAPLDLPADEHPRWDAVGAAADQDAARAADHGDRYQLLVHDSE